jgi:hypothetical protein
MRCRICGEELVFGPRGCACTRASKAEAEAKELARISLKLAFISLDLFDEQKPEEPKT